VQVIGLECLALQKTHFLFEKKKVRPFNLFSFNWHLAGEIRKNNVFRPQKTSEFGIAQRFSFRKYPKSAQNQISVSSTFLHEEHRANSLGHLISKRSAFAFHSLARALAAGLPRQDHV